MITLIYIFIIIAILMGMFSMLVIARDVVIDEKERRQAKNSQNAVTEIKQTVADEPVATVVDTQALEEVVSISVSDDSAVVFSTATQTLEEK